MRKFDELEDLYQGKYIGKEMLIKSNTKCNPSKRIKFMGFERFDILGEVLIKSESNEPERTIDFKDNFLKMFECKLINNDAKDDVKDDSNDEVSRYTDITDEMKDIGMLLCVKHILTTVKDPELMAIAKRISVRNAKICLGKKGFKYPNITEIQKMFDDVTGLENIDFAKYINNSIFVFKYHSDYNAINDTINDYVVIWKDYIKSEFDNNADNLYKKYDINNVNKLYPWERIMPIKTYINLYIELPNIKASVSKHKRHKRQSNRMGNHKSNRLIQAPIQQMSIKQMTSLEMQQMPHNKNAYLYNRIFTCPPNPNPQIQQQQQQQQASFHNNPNPQIQQIQQQQLLLQQQLLQQQQASFHNNPINNKCGYSNNTTHTCVHQNRVPMNFIGPINPNPMQQIQAPILGQQRISNTSINNNNTISSYGNKPRLPGLSQPYTFLPSNPVRQRIYQPSIQQMNKISAQIQLQLLNPTPMINNTTQNMINSNNKYCKKNSMTWHQQLYGNKPRLPGLSQPYTCPPSNLINSFHPLRPSCHQ